MLAIFHKGLAHPPEELKCPNHNNGGIPQMHVNNQCMPKHPLDILKNFNSAQTNHCFSTSFTNGAALACTTTKGLQQRLFCSFDNVYCMFVGYLNNLSSLVKDYGQGSKSNEAMLVIEAYRTLYNRGPYPADQVLKSLNGSFAFVVYDNKTGIVFAALSSDGRIPLYWGVAADGSLVICDDINIVKESCGKSFAPFPAGCMFHSEGGLKSFEHPMNKMKAMPRVDSEGIMCGASFNVDTQTKIYSMPRVGSSANWSSWGDI